MVKQLSVDTRLYLSENPAGCQQKIQVDASRADILLGNSPGMRENKGTMAVFHSLVQYLKDYILLNPIAWGILAVVLWIVGAAFIKAWRGKDGGEDGEI